MIKPDVPANEALRLNNLRSLNILDTAAEERFDRLTRLAKRLFDVPIAIVSLVDEHRQWFKSALGLSISETSCESSFCSHAIPNDEMLVVPDTQHDPRFVDNPFVSNEPYIRFYAGCPLRYLDGSRLGTLCIIDSFPRIFSPDTLEALKDLAEIAERELIAIQLATMDDLTGISNRRGFSVLAQNSLNLCMRHEIPATLVFFDINKFKEINDNFGHAEGDRALVEFARQMNRTFRDSDVVARLGGDEFVVLLTNTTELQAEELVLRLQLAIDSHNLTSNGQYKLTFSSGVVTVKNRKFSSIDSILQQADTLMYKNKRQFAHY